MGQPSQSGDTCVPQTVRPRARAHEVVERTVDSSLLLYDLQCQRVHVLNETAALIWRLCDGDHSTDEIAALVAAHYSAQLDVAERDVADLLQALADERLLSI